MGVTVPVDEGIVDGEIHNEVHQQLLDAGRCCRILNAIASSSIKETN